jgi:hypothetical protein
MLTSDGSGGAVAETNLTFDGTNLTLGGSGIINANSRHLYWSNGNTFWAGGEDIAGLTAVADEGVTSVNNGASLDAWYDIKYNGTVLTDQTNDANAKNAGQLVSLRDNSTWQIADADDATSTKLLGICLNNVDPNETLSVLLEGQIAISYHDQLASALPGVALYVSLNAGNVTETAPTAAGDYVRLIGHNIYDNTDVVVIRFDPDNTWILL